VLSPETAGEIRALVTEAQAADKVAPMSEDALFRLRASGAHQDQGAGSRHFVLAAPGGALAGYAQLTGPEPGAEDDDLSGELVIRPGFREQGFGSALAAALIGDAHGDSIRIWAHGDLPAAAALAKSAGFSRDRSLWQMRLGLAGADLPEPAYQAGVTVRTFRPGTDEEAWLAVNRSAFAHHPEQGSWTSEDLALREAEPWFDPEGFFLAERDGRLAGFHWTKVHPAGGADGAPIGEVYVVGVDPGQQGGGLGRALTLTGLHYLQRRGLAGVLLYVDESNATATRMYAGLGFSRWSTDVMYRR
jgi:mycothiol synthase